MIRTQTCAAVCLFLVMAFLPGATRPVAAASLANPASQYCISIGGKLKMVRSRNGSVRADCILKNGRRIDEWALYRAHHK